jgi:hypothetical protein
MCNTQWVSRLRQAPLAVSTMEYESSRNPIVLTCMCFLQLFFHSDSDYYRAL